MSVWLQQSKQTEKGDREVRCAMEHDLISHGKNFGSYSATVGSHCSILTGILICSDFYLGESLYVEDKEAEGGGRTQVTSLL